MGKTKTVFVGSEEPTAKEKESKKQPKKKAVSGVGLKGGERIKVVEAGPVISAREEKKEKEVKKVRRQPKVRSQKYQAAKAKIDPDKTYPLLEAIKLVKQTSYSRFDGTVELHLVVKKQGLTASVDLPFGTGKEKRIEIANTQTIEKLKQGKIDFDVLLATPEMMTQLVPFAKVLGPKGLMPNPKNKTLIKSEAEAKKFSANTLNLKTEAKAPLIHTAIGKVSMTEKELKENILAVLEAINKKQIKKAVLTSTMGPGVKLEID